ncbi:hypothetical protein [Caballeronia sp. M23-90]
MNQIILRVPHEEVASFLEDVTAWTSNSGIDPRVSQFPEPGITTNTSLPIRYLVEVDDSFFEQYPHWRQCIEQ